MSGGRRRGNGARVLGARREDDVAAAQRDEAVMGRSAARGVERDDVDVGQRDELALAGVEVIGQPAAVALDGQANGAGEAIPLGLDDDPLFTLVHARDPSGPVGVIQRTGHQYDRNMNVSRRLHRLALAALAAGILLAAAASAGARTVVTIDGSVTPPITAFTLKPQILSLELDLRFASDVPGGLPGTVARTTIFFPHGPRVNSALFPSCDPQRLLRQRGRPSACPSGSRIGGGTAFGTSPSFEGVNERLTVDLYNGPRGRSIVMYLRGLNPVAISGMINASFTPLRGGRWGYRLSLRVPENLQEISPDILASLLRFTTRVGGSVRVREGGRTVRRGYIEVLACPPGALVPVRGLFGFRDGSTATTDSYIACGRR